MSDLAGLALPTMDAAALLAAGRELPERFRLAGLNFTAPGRGSESAAGEPHVAGTSGADLESLEILRLLPGRRLVARVQLAGREAVLKLFLGPGAARYCRREARGCARLAAAGVATPLRLGEVSGAGARGLLFEYLAGARAVDAGDDAGLAAAAAELGRLHRAGSRHGDLHLDNFLWAKGRDRVLLIDGDGVRAARGPLGRRRQRRDLAVLCAQRPPLADGRLAPVLAAYLSTAGATAAGTESLPPAALAQLEAATRRARRRRLAAYLRKAQRDCTEYLRQRSWRSHVLAVRAEWNDALAAFAGDPEAALAGAEMLKAGNSATVVRTRIGGESRIVKRYNLKSPWQALRRTLRPLARYRRAWLNGQRLHLLQIATARPLLLVERRWGPLRGTAYLVMEDRGHGDLAAEVAESGLTDARLAELVALFGALAAAELVHEDTKASNFLVGSPGLWLIDLDAMHWRRRGQDLDRQRFLANFAGQPEVRGRLELALDRAGPPPRS